MLGFACSNQTMPITKQNTKNASEPKENRFIQTESTKKKRLNQSQFRTPKDNFHLLISFHKPRQTNSTEEQQNSVLSNA
jgi:hypothetical protein